MDGGSPQTYLVPFAVTGDGAHTVTFNSADAAGNTETAHTLALTISTTPPTTTAALSGTLGNGGWYKSAVKVTLTASDLNGAAYVSNTSYTVDGGSRHTYSAPLTVSGDGTHTITFWSVDKARNTEAANSQTVKIDATAPAVTFGAASPAANTAGWNNGTVSLPYTAADTASGMAAALPAGPLTFATEGKSQKQTVTVTDNAGNTKALISPAVNIDLTAPVTTKSVSGPNVSGIYTGSASISLSATDSLSGVASTSYTLDGGAQQTYTTPVAVSGSGVHTLTYGSVDKAGNAEVANTLTLTISTVPPTTTASLSGTAGNNGWYKSAVKVTLIASDPNGATYIAATYYTMDGGSRQTYSAPLTVSGDGTHTITFWSVDKAGNTEAVNSQTVKIDATAPTLTSARPRLRPIPRDGTTARSAWPTRPPMLPPV